MSAPADMVAFAEDWGRHPTSSQHLIRHLAGDRRILYINSLGLRRPRFNIRDASRVVSKLVDAARTKTQSKSADFATTSNTDTPIDAPPPNVHIHAPVAISWPGSSLAFHTNRQLLGRQLRNKLTAHGITHPIMWTSLPSALPAVGQLNERALVYYCCDDFGSLVGVDHAPVMAMEQRLVEKADLVFATSEVLADRFPADKTVLIPHGTDLGLFSTPAPRASDLPKSSKIAGFYGSLDDRLNLNMLAEAAAILQDWHFVLIGPVKTDLSAIECVPNVHVLGARAYSDLPRYVQHWHVSMMLYRYDDQVHAGNPLKMREYLAAGTPITTIAVPALKPYAHLVSIAKTPDDYARAIVTAANDQTRNRMRIEAVANDSWQDRANTISEHLDRL